jgi:hypothetical protein
MAPPTAVAVLVVPADGLALVALVLMAWARPGPGGTPSWSAWAPLRGGHLEHRADQRRRAELAPRSVGRLLGGPCRPLAAGRRCPPRAATALVPPPPVTDRLATLRLSLAGPAGQLDRHGRAAWGWVAALATADLGLVLTVSRRLFFARPLVLLALVLLAFEAAQVPAVQRGRRIRRYGWVPRPITHVALDQMARADAIELRAADGPGRPGRRGGADPTGPSSPSPSTTPPPGRRW